MRRPKHRYDNIFVTTGIEVQSFCLLSSDCNTEVRKALEKDKGQRVKQKLNVDKVKFIHLYTLTQRILC